MSRSSAAASGIVPPISGRRPLFLQRIDWATVCMVIAIKVLLFLFAWQAYQIFANHKFGWLAIWNHWDARIYLDLAREGYVSTGPHRLWIVFYPLYGWLVRLVALIVRNYLVAALVVSTIASVVCGLLLQRLVRIDYSAHTARNSVWFLFIFPTSYFLHIGYTESLFLALTLGAFVAARSKHWLIAGLAGALASLTRVNGCFLLPALAIEAWEEFRVTNRFDVRWLWLGLVGFGPAIYLCLNHHVAGSFFAFSHAADLGWHKTLEPPWSGLKDLVLGFTVESPTEQIMLCLQEVIFVTLGLAGAVWCCFHLRLSYAFWMIVNLLLFTSTSFISSTPRYLLILFPLFIAFALVSARHMLFRVIVTVWSLLFLGLFVIAFVLNHWAF